MSLCSRRRRGAERDQEYHSLPAESTTNPAIAEATTPRRSTILHSPCHAEGLCGCTTLGGLFLARNRNRGPLPDRDGRTESCGRPQFVAKCMLRIVLTLFSHTDGNFHVSIRSLKHETKTLRSAGSTFGFVSAPDGCISKPISTNEGRFASPRTLASLRQASIAGCTFVRRTALISSGSNMSLSHGWSCGGDVPWPSMIRRPRFGLRSE
jgi:hypothetical protein